MKTKIKNQGLKIAAGFFGKKPNSKPFNFAVDGKLRQTNSNCRGATTFQNGGRDLDFRFGTKIQPLNERKENASN